QIGGAQDEERPAKSGRKPEAGADPDTQKSKNAPTTVVEPDLELKRASARPTDLLRRPIREKDVRDETERKADHPDIQHERIEKEDADDAQPRARLLSEIEMDERQQQAQAKNHQT